MLCIPGATIGFVFGLSVMLDNEFDDLIYAIDKVCRTIIVNQIGSLDSE